MHLSAPIRFHEPRVLSPSSYRTSESTTGLVDHLLHSRLTGTRPVHFPAVRPTFSHLVNIFSSSPLSPEPSLTCLGPSLGPSLSHLRPPHISWLSHHSQVCCSIACIDTCAVFGASPSCGIYGQMADAGAEILRSNGIGRLDKWVDDHIFFRIPCVQLQNYNHARRVWHNDIKQTGMRHTGLRIWYSGKSHDGNILEEFSEDCSFPIRNLLTATE